MRILSTIIFIIMSLVNLNAQIEKVEDLFSDYHAGESPGASVLVAMNGKIVFVKTYGYADLIPDTTTIQVKDADVLQMMYGQTSTYFEPGAQFKYSNTGYALLAMII